MKIGTNEIGSYGINHISNNNLKVNADNQLTEKVTPEEKKFFASMYPEKSKEIMNYEFYNLKGKVSGVSIGSLFDKRG